MKLTVKNAKGNKVEIFDTMKRKISNVVEFDTKTCKITFFVSCGPTFEILSELDSKGKPRAKKVSTIWRGAYAVVDGVRLKQ